MRFLVLLATLAAFVKAADIIDPSTCINYPCLIFDDEFDFLDFEAWEHEITMTGGGNGEFEAYVNNRSITYTHDGIFYIKPDLTANMYGEDFLTEGQWDMWGLFATNDKCTGNEFYGCMRDGANGLLNPILSGKIRTLPFFNFRYGRVEFRAKMPSGAWLWPAIWLMPTYSIYGTWPASGEIDVVESRGNLDYGDEGLQNAGSTMHWGPSKDYNKFYKTHEVYPTSNGGTFGDDFHIWTLDWSSDNIKFFLDGELKLTVDPGTDFWSYGHLNITGMENPWRYGSKMAPFDQKYYLMINLAVGGTNGYFPDDVDSDPPKPWANSDPTAQAEFWQGKDSWLPTWEHDEGKISEKAALQVDYIKVWKLSAE